VRLRPGAGAATQRRDVTYPFDAAIARTAARYARSTGIPRATRTYVASKLRTDPAARAIAERAPLGDVLDLGCGRGQLAVLLLESGSALSVRGLDWDAKKVAIARAASEGLPARFDVGDVRDDASAGVEPADAVLLVDVLHYLSAEEQDALLARAADLVRPRGRLLVREASRGHGARSAVTELAEHVGRAARLNLGERLLFRDVAKDLAPRLAARGFVCSVEPCWHGTPLANVLLDARRP
jgi:2-polyprenyl-3-methyl-5-hydroxy-6-metoxy-1,4-benzoquinol methylase